MYTPVSSYRNKIQTLDLSLKYRTKDSNFGSLITNQDPGGEGVRRAAIREGTESDFSGGVLSLTESGAVVRALEDLAVEVNGGLEPRRVVWTFS